MRHNIMQKKRRDHIEEGEQAYQAWRDTLLGDPEAREIYKEEAAKKELWLQLVEARQAAGLTQAELARRLGVSQAQVAGIVKRKKPPCARRVHTTAMVKIARSNETVFNS